MTNELVLIKESKVTALMEGSRDDDKLEASGVYAFGGHYYVVFDNEEVIAVIDDKSWSANGPGRISSNRFVGGAEKSEGVTLAPDGQRWVLVEEERLRSGDDKPSIRNGRVYEYLLSSGSDVLERVNRSWLPFNFKRRNKGFEGVSLVRHGGEEYLLALCEGNDCAGKSRGRRPGNGRIKVFIRDDDEFDYAASIDLPRSLPFIDFSGMDVRDGILALVSQESSALWVGKLDPEHWRVRDGGKVYTFPRERDGAVSYCNVEGVSWVDEKTLVVVSDARKVSEQPPSCAAKEQSIHVFRIPIH
ncbi:MAG: hypothetical protein ACR2P3_09755 [Geminicoccaceae bacterium]